MKLAIPLDLPFKTVEQIALQFNDSSAAQACHVNVVALWPSLVEMLFSLHVHEIEFINQSMPLQQFESAIDSYAINPWVKFARLAQDLRGVHVKLGGFDHAQDGSALVGQTKATRR